MMIYKKYTPFYCENEHLYFVTTRDIYQYEPLLVTDVEFAREQGKVLNGDRFICKVCGGEIILPKKVEHDQ